MNIKEKIINEIEKDIFPDLKFLFSKEVLDISLEVLRELLILEKQKFYLLLKIEKKDIKFDIFNDKNTLWYFWSLLNHLNNVSKTDQIKYIIDQFEAEYIDFLDEVSFNKDYFKLYKYCLKNCKLDKEQERIISETIKVFKLEWIDKSKKIQDEIKLINKRLAKLSQDFENNIVDDQSKFSYHIKDFSIIKDLPEISLNFAFNNAKDKWLEWYLFNWDPSLYSDILKYCSDTKIRYNFYYAFVNFASKWLSDNRPLILEILKLKQKKAKLLWYNNFAEYNMLRKMADSPEQVIDLISWISKKARTKAFQELEEIRQYFNISDIEAHDLAYYTRILKEEKYNVNDKEIKEYFEFENSLLYLHDLVNKLYWIRLKELKIDSYSDDIRIYEVYKWDNFISYYFLDTFYKETKKPWAWADNLREKYFFDNQNKYPIIVNVCNFQKTDSWKILLSLRDLETLFHEFWHALHEILSKSKYSDLSWFWVEWDFIELPSQIHENWVSEKESLKKLSKHYISNKPINDELLEKLELLKTFMSWNFVLRQNEFAILDMHLYTTDLANSVEELDKIILDKINKISIFERDEKYKMYSSFSHIFWWWYAAWYYSYMWAEIIEADIFSEFKKNGIFNKETWERFLHTILWAWSLKSAKDMFFDFMWRELSDKSFLERKGFI